MASPDLPTRAVTLVKEKKLEDKFGDFDDHLENVTIGKCLALSKYSHNSAMFTRLVKKSTLFASEFIMQSPLFIVSDLYALLSLMAVAFGCHCLSVRTPDKKWDSIQVRGSCFPLLSMSTVLPQGAGYGVGTSTA